MNIRIIAPLIAFSLGCQADPCGDLDPEACMLAADALATASGPMMLAACNQGSHQACVEVTTDLIQGSHGDTHRIELASRFARAGHAEGWDFALTYVGIMYAAKPTPDWVRAANWFSHACLEGAQAGCVYEVDARHNGGLSPGIATRDAIMATATSVTGFPPGFFVLESELEVTRLHFNEGVNQFPELPLAPVAE